MNEMVEYGGQRKKEDKKEDKKRKRKREKVYKVCGLLQ